MLQINTFQYNPADVDCNQCAKYGGKEQGCTAKTCPWLAKRIEAGVAGYEEAIRETFPHDAHLDARLRTVVRHFTGSLFLDPSHEQRMECMKIEQGHCPKRNTPAYYAAMYLLTSDEGLCRRTEVEELLEGMDYNSLIQAVRHEAKTVYAYATYGKPPQTFDYRGADLFGQRATLLYDDFDQSDAAQVLAERRYELWLLEDMSLVVVSCVSVDFAGGEFVTEYREIKQGDPWNTPMCLNLEELAENLFEMFGQCYEHTLPVYEL